MTQLAHERAAELLHTARRNCRPIAELPADCRPMTAAEAYRAQDAFLAQSGDRVAGLKIGATSDRAQAFLATDAPFAGCVLSRDVFDSPATLPAGRFPFRLIEPEFAVRLGRDLPAGDTAYDGATVADAVASLHPAIELVTSGLADWAHQGVLSLIADNGVNGALVLGPACSAWRDFDLPHHTVALRVNGVPAGEGVGANTLGGPMNALAWLANHRAARGLGLAAGQVITTGVVTPFVELAAGDEAVADFGSLGTVELRFSD